MEGAVPGMPHRPESIQGAYRGQKGCGGGLAVFVFAEPNDLADAEVGYCGPVDTYDRYMAGEVVTRTDCLTDLSEFVVRPMDLRDQDRLRWMLANLLR